MPNLFFKTIIIFFLILTLLLNAKKDSNYNTAIKYFNEKKYKEALEIFLNLANDGNQSAQEYSGYMYEFGYGVEIDYQKAINWYEKALKLGSIYVLNRLGIIYFEGKGVEKNNKKAFKYYLQSAKNGNTNSMEFVAYMYEYGYGVDKDYTNALEWYNKGINNNSKYAYYGMGIMLFDGKGIEKNYKEAFKNFKKSAEMGMKEAQEYSGYMYEFGYGTDKDYNLAIEWYLKAAGQNSSYAQTRLGKLYYEGKGVQKDNNNAYNWLSKAASQGNNEAKKLLEEILNSGYKSKESIGSKDIIGPIIYINHKETPSNINNSSSKVAGKALDDSGVAIVYVNNKEAQIDSEGNFNTSILLKVGENSVVIKAIDIYENQSSESLIINRTSQVIDENKNKKNIALSNWYKNQFAIVIGINDYLNKDLPDLKNAENDAKSLSGILAISGYKVKKLLGKEATRKNILLLIKNLKNEITINDSFLLFFAGHGQAISTIHGNKKIGYLIPYDANLSLESGDIMDYDEQAISLDQLKKYINDIPAKHIALILDSCFSGLAMETRGLRPSRNRENNNEYYESLLQNKSINILTAGDDQPVSDGLDHSPFTRAIIMALDKGNIDITDNDGFATFSELAVFVKMKVENFTDRRQRPQYDNLSEDDGDYIFLIK